MKKTLGLLCSLLLLLSGCNAADPDAVSQATLVRFRENEIMEYQGTQ
jgi:hypothetical protein